MRPLFLMIAFVSLLPAQSQAVLAGLATGSYFPLDLGDRWVYREDTRFQTATYQTWRVDRTETKNGNTYSVMAIEGPGSSYAESWFRMDSTGRIYLLTGDGDALFLDPSLVAPNSGQMQFTGPAGAVSTAFGTFQDTMNYLYLYGWDRETGVLARGLGLLSSTDVHEEGSNTGPVLIRTLVEADIAGGIHFPALRSSIELGLESLNLDVSGRNVTNCAVPCYFAACNVVPGADPKGTYKPCAQARIALKNWTSNQSRAVTLQLLAPDGSTAFQSALTLDSAATDSVTFLQLPLYSAPNQPIAPGDYRLSAATADGAAAASVKVTIR